MIARNISFEETCAQSLIAFFKKHASHKGLPEN